MSLFPLRAGVANHREASTCFLMGWARQRVQISLGKWAKLCSPIFEGGLGVRKLLMFNRALLGRWLWRYELERGLVESGG
jgi:hypothetical protein